MNLYVMSTQIEINRKCSAPKANLLFAQWCTVSLSGLPATAILGLFVIWF